MSFLELLLIGVGLSMDAFAVAICQGLCMPKLNWRYTTEIAIFFGGFQALMPFLGWALGSQFAGYIQNIDHWVAYDSRCFGSRRGRGCVRGCTKAGP